MSIFLNIGSAKRHEETMVRLVFLLPLLMSLGWYLFLRNYGIPLKQGLRGFIYIGAFNAIIALVLWALILITNR
ncbi:hypothetical protein [Alishewanella sp. HL-SH05]|uniref:hypothetical protein n=1 Tax=Alishewanella sp. HL-SH05 TaxID=3461145 RepID=UPI0040433302